MPEGIGYGPDMLAQLIGGGAGAVPMGVDVGASIGGVDLAGLSAEAPIDPETMEVAAAAKIVQALIDEIGIEGVQQLIQEMQGGMSDGE